MNMDFYRFEIDDDRFGSNYGFSISNPLQFQDAPNDLVIYMDRDTNEWVAQSGEGIDFGPEDDLDTIMSDIASTYGADDYKIEQDEDYDMSTEASDIQVASFNLPNYSYSSAMTDMLRYGIDIDIDSSTVTGRRSSISKWKKAKMKTAAIPGWKMLDFDLYELQNGKEDTFISIANDGLWHLYSNGLDLGSFNDPDTAMENAEPILHHDIPDFEAPWWPDEIDTPGDEIKTAGVWKLDIDRPLTIQEKKTFLDNSIDVNESEQDDGTNVITMTGSDKAIADTAELLDLTSDFVQDAYQPSVSLEDSASDTDDADIDDETYDSMPDEVKQDIDNDEELSKPDDEAKDKIIDGVIDMLDGWRDDISDRNASKTAAKSVCPMCLNSTDDEDMVYCDAADLDMCNECCEELCNLETGETDKMDKIAYRDNTCITNEAEPWGFYKTDWLSSYYLGEKGNPDNSYLISIEEEDDGWSFTVKDPYDREYNSPVYKTFEEADEAVSDYVDENCQEVDDYEIGDYWLDDGSYMEASVNAGSHGHDCDYEDDEDKTSCEASVKTSKVYAMEFDGIYDEPIYNETDGYYDIGHESVLVEADSESEARQKIIDKFPDASDIRLMYDQRTHPATPEIYDSVDEFYEKFPYSSIKTLEKTETMPGYQDWMDDASDHVEASVKKAHHSDIQMMLGDTGYYWHLEVMDDAGHIIKEGDYASEELASEAANSMIGKETDVPVADVDGTVFDQSEYIMDDTSDYDDWDDIYDECLEDDFESYAEDGCPTVDDIVNDDEDYLEEADETLPEANRKGKLIMASKNIRKSSISASVTYPNGEPVSDIDLDTYLDYMYGTDRDKDNSKYTEAEKQRATNYWFKKHGPTVDDIVNDDEDYLEEADRKGKSITASTITAYNASDFDESSTYEYGGQKYMIHDTKSSDPLLPGYKILQISEIHPYDDADYAWAIYDAADNPNYARIVRNGKTEDRIAISPWADNEEYYEEYYDADSALDQYRDEVIIQLAYALRESNEDVKPMIVNY